MAPYQYDLFVSYAHDNNTREAWVDEFIEAIKYEYQVQTGKSLSVFRDKDLSVGGRKDKVLAAVKASRCLLAVMSPSYFRSQECREQWEHFRAVEEFQGTHDLVIPAYYAADEFFDTAATDQQADKWLKDLAQRQPVDFRDYRLSGPQVFQSEGPLGKEVREKVTYLVWGLREALRKAPIKAPILDVKVLGPLRSLALLSVLALRLDRFKEGGWGLSWRNCFIHSRDSRFFRTGLPEVNLLVLRALRSFLPKESLVEEVEHGLQMQIASNNAAGVSVDDRKARFTYLLGLMQNMPHTDMMIGDSLSEARQELSQRPFIQRWTLSAKRYQSSNDHYVLFYELIARIHADTALLGRILRTQKGGTTDQTKTQLTAHLLKAHLTEAEGVARDWIRRQSLFIQLAEDRSFTDSVELMGRDDEAWVLRLLNYRALASVRLCVRKVLVENLFDLKTYCSEIESNLDRLRSLKRSSRSLEKELGQALLYYSLYLAILLDLNYHTTDGVPDAHLKKIESDWQSLLVHPDAGKAMLQGNCALWEALLLLAERYEVRPDVSTCQKIWKLGGEIQDARRRAIKERLRDIGTKKEKIDLSGFYADQYEEVKKCVGKDFEVLGGLDKAFQSAMFWGFGDSDSQPVQVKIESGDVGYLETRLDNNTIVYANDLYNRMFLTPFGTLTGISIYDLERLIREFGSADQDLVRLIGQTVVERAYMFPAASPPNFSRRNFERRTNDIIEYIFQRKNGAGSDVPKSPAETLEKCDACNVLDVLKLRTGTLEERYVLRSVSLRSAPRVPSEEHTSPEVLGEENQDTQEILGEQQETILCWQFVEFTKEMNALMDKIPSE